MKKNTFIIFLLLLCITGVFFAGKIFSTYSHSMLQESKYPFYLREILAKNMPTCSDYKSISNSSDKLEVKILEDGNKERVAMFVTTEESDGNARLFVSIINIRHEQYFDEIILDCPLNE